jgi:L,D-peptidoglycan transpeptidase YkuD (ErfK/YbiS/YcfS/YnhG family)
MQIPADRALVLARPGATVGRLLRGPEARPFPCALGRAGIVSAEAKREGDGGTPTGLLPLRRLLFRADRLSRPACAVPAEPIAPDDGWCDDAADAAYNRRVRLPFAPGHEQPGHEQPGHEQPSHERLWREDAVYDLIGVLGWNDAPSVPGRGSAIFLHLARPGLTPTEGCVALALPDLLAILPGLAAIEVRLEQP